MNRRGSAMLIALAVLTGLVALVATLSAGFTGDLKAQSDRMTARRAQLMADAGLQRAVTELQSLSVGKATLSDSWATLGHQGTADYTVGADSFRVQVIDSGSKVNLDTADADTLKGLPLTSDQVDCLMDWRETKTDPRPTGAKDEYYNQLAKPYNTKLQSLGSLDELLMIRDFSPSTLYEGSAHRALADLATVDSVSSDRDPNGNPKINLQSATINQLSAIGVTTNVANSVIQSQGSFQRMGDVLTVQGMDQASAKALLNYCSIGTTPSTQGLININTSPEAVLAAVPKLDPDIASSIVERQKDGFVGLGDLVDIPGLEISALAKVVDRFCISSRAFEVRVLGFAAGAYCAIQAELLIDDKGNVSIVRQQPAPFLDPTSHWGWPSEAADHETIEGAW